MSLLAGFAVFFTEIGIAIYHRIHAHPFGIYGAEKVGKTTLARKLISEDKNIELSISITTRKPRKLEKNKEDYLFVSEKRFNNMIKRNMFLEHANVFGNKSEFLRINMFPKLHSFAKYR